MMGLAKYLREQEMANVEIDGAARLDAHKAVLARKPMIREVFLEFHQLFRALQTEYLTGEGQLVEIGAGVAPMRDSYADVLATDIVPGAHLDRVIDAQNMSFPDNSVAAIFAQNCFHHLPDPESFFRECTRVLVLGGGAILIEPYHGPVASFLYRRLFATEGFDKRYPDWKTPQSGPMNGANQALSYIVFTRDRVRFESLFPALRVVHHAPLGNYVRYLLSGGLNFKQLVPDASSGLLKRVERGLAPLHPMLALHQVIVLRKVAEPAQN